MMHEYYDSHSSPNAHKIERYLERIPKNTHSAESILRHEVQRLRELDSSHGKLETRQFKADLKAVNHFLEKSKILPHLQIVTDGEHTGEIHKSSKPANSDTHSLQIKHPHMGRHEHNGDHQKQEKHSHTGKHAHRNHLYKGEHARADHPHPHAHEARHSHKGRQSHKGHHRKSRHSLNADFPEANASPQHGADFSAGTDGMLHSEEGIKSSAGGKDSGLQPRFENRLETRERFAAPDTKMDTTPEAEGVGQNRLDTLNSAIERARAGGRPVSIVQIGDSHIAGGVETSALSNKFAESQGLSGHQVEYAHKGVVGKSASYAAAHPDEFLSKVNSRTDLVVVSFGSNESTTQATNQYRRDYAHLVQEIRQRAPNASIAMVGPTDGAFWNSRRELPGLNSVTEAQKSVQTTTPNSVYVDIRPLVGSIATMRSRGMLSNDNLHLTTSGYQVVGRTIANNINPSA